MCHVACARSVRRKADGLAVKEMPAMREKSHSTSDGESLFRQITGNFRLPSPEMREGVSRQSKIVLRIG